MHPRRMLAKAAIRPKKRYGQNFLVSASAARRIAQLSLADARPEVQTLEVGAGTGALTRALVQEGADVTAIEIDPALVELLRSRVDLATARIVQADALTFDYAVWSSGRPWRVAGNLPYNIATPLLLRFVEMRSGGPQLLTVMVQKDVADRLAASPGTPAYGSLSVAVQYAMHVERAFTLAPQSFFPPPKVRSTVVRMVRRAEAVVRPRDLELFWKVVRGAFAYRRKTLVNSLTLFGFDRAPVARALALSNLSPELRGERLDITDFVRLADALAEE
jgi:16S rRNA (adenine1518-N6/adenine1519-N6)-dimethyltransferase